jgi:hypothetical protein
VPVECFTQNRQQGTDIISFGIWSEPGKSEKTVRGGKRGR